MTSIEDVKRKQQELERGQEELKQMIAMMYPAPCPLELGEQIKFTPISERFHDVGLSCFAGELVIKPNTTGVKHWGDKMLVIMLPATRSRALWMARLLIGKESD